MTKNKLTLFALLFVLSGCSLQHTGYNKSQLAGSWKTTYEGKIYSLKLQAHNKANGKFYGKSIGQCVWSVGNSLSEAENLYNTTGDYLAIICKQQNRVYSYHIDKLTKGKLTLNYIIWGQQFQFVATQNNS